MYYLHRKKSLAWVSMWIRAADVMNLLVSAVGLTLGVFVIVAPHRAAAIWGSERLEKLAPPRRSLFLQWYRVFGITLCLSAILFALDTVAFR
jgi:hypothetical protein